MVKELGNLLITLFVWWRLLFYPARPSAAQIGKWLQTIVNSEKLPETARESMELVLKDELTLRRLSD